jgi:type II secretory pathway predicted ATPase ExeA
MNDQSLTALGLSRPPFSKEIPDSDLWMPSSRQAVVDELVEALEARQSALLVGEPGVGKSCVLRALRKRLTGERFRLTYCHNATLGRRDFYRQLCLALGLSPKATAASLFFAVSSHVQDLTGARIHPVLFLDEAHLLHPDVLGHLHILLNYEWDSKALLSVVLVGLPELADRLALTAHKPLLSRLNARLRIDAVNADDTAEYLQHRLKVAGASRELLSREAVELLHGHSGGIHRDLDRLADLAWRDLVRRKRKVVEADHLRPLLGKDSRAA